MTEQIYKDIETIKAQLIENDTPEYSVLIGDLLTETWLLLDTPHTVYNISSEKSWKNVINIINIYHSRLDLRDTDMWDAIYLLNAIGKSEDDEYMKCHNKILFKIRERKNKEFLLKLFEDTEKKYLIWKQKYGQES